MKKSNQYVLKIVGCMVFVMICAIIVFTYQDFPARLMAAILGVVITATITVVLLDGQSKKEQTAKRNSKVFEEKLKIYQNFLSTLYDVVKDRKLTEEEKLQLEFQTSLVAMHCKPKSLNLVSAAVRNVISSFCPSNEKEKQKSQGNIPLLESLLSVVEALRIDLYGVDKEKDAYILNQYNDSVGKEHYIVYIDADKIVVDTLGDSLQVYPLGKVETYQYLPNVDFNDGKFSMERYNSTDCTIKADTAKKQIMVSDDTFYPKGKIVKFSELKAYKRDYVLIPTTQQTLIAFLNKKMEVYTGNPADIREDERGFALDYVGQCRDYLSGMPGGLPDDLVFEVCSYNARMDFHGKLTSKSNIVNISGVEIPVTAFGTPEIDSYYQKVIEELHPTYYWNCQNCYKVVKSETKPESGLCEANFFTGSMSTWTFHRWVRLCKVGSAHTYQCQNCGIQVQTNDVPQMGACREGANHVWNQLQ